MSTNTMGTFAVAGNETIAGYTLVERLGQGGYGEVWRAAAPGGLTKAVKIVYGNFADARGARELKALDRIKDVRHPFLLSLERIEVVDGRLVIVTELADMSLKDRYQQCRAAGLPGIPRKELLAYLRDAADALDFMHDRYSLQHLDVKPENLLIVGGRLKVADFGLVKNLHEVSVSVLDGMTPPYAPPELFSGAPSDRSDQYSLAVVYQEMLTSELPFTGRSAAEWARIHIATSRKANLEPLPAADRRTVDRALARLPIDRFASCSELVNALNGTITHTAGPLSAAGVNAAAERQPSPPRSSPGQSARPAASSFDDIEQTMQMAEFLSNAAAGLDAPAGSSFATPPGHGSGSNTCTMAAGQSKRAIKKLPPVAYEPHLWRPQPTLVIGIGGTGARIVGQWRRRLSQKFGRSANYPAWSALLVDVDEQELLRAVDVEGTVLSSDTLYTPLRSTNEYREESVELLRWISRRWLYNIPHTRQTQGWRPLGRLAFADNGRRFLQRTGERLAEVLSAAAREQSSACVGRDFTASPRIVLVASLCGGTGSGMALDAGYALRQMVQELGIPKAQLMSLLTISAPRDNSLREQALANAYASLKEYRYYTSSPDGFPGDEWCGLAPAPAGVAPFDTTYLLHLGQSLDPEQFATQCNLAAEYLFFDVATPMGQMLDRCREQPGEDAPRAAPGEVRSCRLYPLTFPEAELRGAVESRLHKEIASQWSSHDWELPLGGLQERVRHLPDTARVSAAERVRHVLGGVVRPEIIELICALVAQAQSDGNASNSSIAGALGSLGELMQSWRSTPVHVPNLLPQDPAYVGALRASLQNRLTAIVPALARKVSTGVMLWAMQSLGPGRSGVSSCLDVLNTLPTRTAASVHAEVQRVLAEMQVGPWILPALGDARHAILCWRDFLNQSEPLALAAGGQRRLALIAPASPTTGILCEMLESAFSEPTSVIDNPAGPVVWLLQEAGQIPVMDFANELLTHLDLVKEAASRLHTRIDVSWSDAVRRE